MAVESSLSRLKIPARQAATIRDMDPAQGPTKVCPECQNAIFEADSICGFCGHVFAASGPSSAPPSKTYRYRPWGSYGLYWPASFILVLCVPAATAMAV